jgi:excisionase family DNA binding protein
VQQGGKQCARYVCAAPIQQGVSRNVCWSVSAAAIDAVVARCFLEATQPPEIELSLAVTREVEHQAEEIDKLWKSRLERARYEAQLAERRYKAVDPDNRVVARTLEADWETKLRALDELDGGYRSARQARRVELSDADRREILSLARDLPRVWNATTTSNAQRKNLLRLLVQQVALMPVDIPQRMTRIQILWHTGTVTDAEANRPRYAAGTPACDDAVELIRVRAGEGWRDGQIALELNRRSLASGKRRPWNEQMVRGVRKRRGIPSQNAPAAGQGWGLERSDGLLSTRGVAERLGVSRRTVRAWVEAGRLIPAEGGGRGSPLWFAVDAKTEQRLRNE